MPRTASPTSSPAPPSSGRGLERICPNRRAPTTRATSASPAGRCVRAAALDAAVCCDEWMLSRSEDSSATRIPGRYCEVTAQYVSRSTMVQTPDDIRVDDWRHSWVSALRLRRSHPWASPRRGKRGSAPATSSAFGFHPFAGRALPDGQEPARQMPTRTRMRSGNAPPIGPIRWCSWRNRTRDAFRS